MVTAASSMYQWADTESIAFGFGRVAPIAAQRCVVFLTICSYYAYTRHYRTVSGNAASSPVDSAALQQSTDPPATKDAHLGTRLPTEKPRK
jgi:hypothetical protein